MQHPIRHFAALLALLIPAVPLWGQEPESEVRQASQEIRELAQEYASAFNARKVDALVKHWSPAGVYTNRTTGEQVKGRAEIAEQFSQTFAQDNPPNLAVVTESVDLISPNVALERGIATVSHGDAAVETRYRVVYVRHDTTWLIDRVSEDNVEQQPSHYDELQELEWMVGDFVDDADGVRIETSCSWTRNQNYLARTFKILEGEEIATSGLQVIGWDAQRQEIRSWLFDSDGGFIEGTWRKRDEAWVDQSTATLSDGAGGSFTSVFRPLDDGNYSWKKINRVMDGRILPNVSESIARRN